MPKIGQSKEWQEIAALVQAGKNLSAAQHRRWFEMCQQWDIEYDAEQAAQGGIIRRVVLGTFSEPNLTADESARFRALRDAEHVTRDELHEFTRLREKRDGASQPVQQPAQPEPFPVKVTAHRGPGGAWLAPDGQPINLAELSKRSMSKMTSKENGEQKRHISN